MHIAFLWKREMTARVKLSESLLFFVRRQNRRGREKQTYLASSLVEKTTSANPVGEGREGKWREVEMTVPFEVENGCKTISSKEGEEVYERGGAYRWARRDCGGRRR